MIRLLAVAGTAERRREVRALLASDPTLEIVAEAASLVEANDALARWRPQIVLLDTPSVLHDPSEAVQTLLQAGPRPIVLLPGSRNGEGDVGSEAKAMVLALQAGAIDCVCRPDMTRSGAAETLAGVVHRAAGLRLRPLPTPSPRQIDEGYESNGDVIAIGGGVGGVRALLAILSQFPSRCPPTLVAQSLPASLTATLAACLDAQVRPKVCEAQNDAPLRGGHVYLAPGGFHLETTGSVLAPRCRLIPIPEITPGPSIDRLFLSLARTFMRRAAGVILTGHGRDGAKGLLALRKAGAHTFAQDEASSAVYGMPRIAAAIGGVRRQAALDDLARHVLSVTDRRISPFSVESR